MKFSSDDIVNQTFESRFRGYDADQVREFLTGVAREWDHLVEELRRLRVEHDGSTREIKEYRRRERSLHDALDMAKQVAEEVKHQAERDAELIIAEAELKAERILAGVENRLAHLREELITLQQQRIRFEAELRTVLESHRKMLELFSPTEEMGGGYEILTSADADGDDVDDDFGDEIHAAGQTQPGMSI